MAEHKKAEKKMPGRRKRAFGGRTDKKAEHVYNAQGSPEEKEAKEQKDDGFKRGGAMKAGGHVGGEKSKERMDKRARGGHVGQKMHGMAVHKGNGMGGKFARGGSPMSTAHHLTAADSKHGEGHEGEHVAEEP